MSEPCSPYVLVECIGRSKMAMSQCLGVRFDSSDCCSIAAPILYMYLHN